ncbi:MAG: hypothetical protein ACYDA5_03690 [Vulcanimicrobiaceae bacterium]
MLHEPAFRDADAHSMPKNHLFAGMAENVNKNYLKRCGLVVDFVREFKAV